jgi:hypothetical protein
MKHIDDIAAIAEAGRFRQSLSRAAGDELI